MRRRAFLEILFLKGFIKLEGAAELSSRIGRVIGRDQAQTPRIGLSEAKTGKIQRGSEMGIGHVAVGLGLKRADRGINVGWLIFATLVPDFLLGWFVLAGWETYEVPAGYASGHYLLFTFPVSHGLPADEGWAGIAGSLAWSCTKRRVAALAIGVAVLSHFLLDGIVHVKGLPLAGTSGPAFGLGLWRHLPLALSIEAAMAAVGLWMYWSVVIKDRPGNGSKMAIYIAVLTVVLIVGQAGAPQSPPRASLIASWLIGPPAMAAIAFLLDWRRQAKRA